MTHETFKNNLRCNLPTIQLTITIIGLISTILAVYITYRLAPLAQSDAVMANEIKQMKAEHPSFINRAEFTQVITRLDKISSRLDQVISIELGR